MWAICGSVGFSAAWANGAAVSRQSAAMAARGRICIKSLLGPVHQRHRASFFSEHSLDAERRKTFPQKARLFKSRPLPLLRQAEPLQHGNRHALAALARE